MLCFRLLFVFAMAAGLLSCSDEPILPVPDTGKSRGVIILNEGNFGSGNASLSFYEPDSFRIQHHVFRAANGFFPGDALQSIYILDSLAFMTVSNSGKILVFNTGNFETVATIAGLIAPRYILPFGAGKAVVSDLRNPYLSILNLMNYTIEDQVYIGAGTEQMVSIGENLFAASWSFNNIIFKVNATTMAVTDSITVGIQPNSMVKGKDGNLWVLCDGGYSGNWFGHENARLVKVDPQNLNILKEFIFEDMNASPTELCSNAEGDSLYFLNGGWSTTTSEGAGVYRMSVTAETLPDTPFIAQGDHLFYGLGIDPLTSEIYCSDAIDYLQKGIVFRYSSSGFLTDSFLAGIIPGFFAFR